MNTDEVMRITEKLSNFLSNELAAMTRDERLFTPRDMENAVYQGILAAYEAGEIAMREKAAEVCRKRLVGLGPLGEVTYCADLDSVIRALPLSGAEESTPAELP